MKISLVLQMLNKVSSGGRLKVEHVVDVMKKRYPYVEISSVVGPDSAYDNNRKVSYSRNSLNKYLTGS